MKIHNALFSALSLVNLAVTVGQLANIPAKLHLVAAEKRGRWRRHARGEATGDSSSTLMSMPNTVPATATTGVSTSPVTRAISPTTENSAYPTYSPTIADETSPVTTTESTTSPVSTADVQTLLPTTESPAYPTYSPTTDDATSPVTATAVETIPPMTAFPTQISSNNKPDGTDRQIETGGPTTSPAPTVSASPSAAPIVVLTPTESPVSATLSPSYPPTPTSVTESPLTPPVAPTTASPITSPITNPPSNSPAALPTTGTPTYDPTIAPSSITTDIPTPKPTHIPTHAPSDAPTIPPTIGPTITPTTSTPISSPVTTTPTTMKPTSAPTAQLIGTSTPTVSSTGSPTSQIATSTPTVSSTGLPTAQLIATSTPTGTSNMTDSPVPTLSPLSTSFPTLQLTGPVQTNGLKMILTGIAGIPDREEWESTTSSYYAEIYDKTYSPFAYDHDIEVRITEVESVGSRRSRGLRSLNSTDRALQSNDMSVEVTYTQDMWYRSDDPNIDSTKAFNPLLPLSTDILRNEYVGELKKLEGYDDLTKVSEIFISSDGGDSGGNEPKGLSLGVIVGIAVGIIAALIVLVLGLWHINKKKNNENNNPNDEIPTVMEFTIDQEITSASGTAMGSSIPRSYDHQTIGSMDYDYAAAYGGMEVGEASEAGGTMGSRTRQTAADADDMAIVSGVAESGVSVFSEDPTFDQMYNSDLHEEILEVYAPAGKLGVVIDTPNDGAPVVHAVKDTSPLADKIKVGDKLVAVDDEDTRTMTAMKISKLLARKKDNQSRKLTIIRLTKR